MLLLLLFCSFVNSSPVLNEEARWARAILPHDVQVPLAESLPRIHVSDLDLPHNQPYKERLKPFILVGAMDGWPLLEKWPIIKGKEPYYLAELFPRAVSDFYPYNMLKQGSHPYLFRFGKGIQEIMSPSGRFGDFEGREWVCPHVQGCMYIHMQLTPDTWNQLEAIGDIPAKRHVHLEGDKWWMRRCLKDPQVQEEYHIKTHWKIILIGSVGSGMFNHSDSLMTSSWHGHVQGKKWWYVCSPEGQRPQKCYESVLQPGEVLYYGPGWHHSTRNLENPSMTVTGTVVTKHNFETIADKLHSECSRKALSFSFSGKLCDALDSCYPLWHKYLKGSEAPSARWPKWRSIASKEEIATKDSTKPTENNYDGRNYIGE